MTRLTVELRRVSQMFARVCQRLSAHRFRRDPAPSYGSPATVTLTVVASTGVCDGAAAETGAGWPAVVVVRCDTARDSRTVLFAVPHGADDAPPLVRVGAWSACDSLESQFGVTAGGVESVAYTGRRLCIRSLEHALPLYFDATEGVDRLTPLHAALWFDGSARRKAAAAGRRTDHRARERSIGREV